MNLSTDIELAEWGLRLLKDNRLEVVLLPAPDKRHVGHKVRAAVNSNPAFYSRMCSRRTSLGRRDKVKTDGKLKPRLVRALKRIIEDRRHPQGMEDEVLEELRIEEMEGQRS